MREKQAIEIIAAIDTDPAKGCRVTWAKSSVHRTPLGREISADAKKCWSRPPTCHFIPPLFATPQSWTAVIELCLGCEDSDTCRIGSSRKLDMHTARKEDMTGVAKKRWNE